MMPKKSYVLILSAMSVTACGGGGGGGGGMAGASATPSLVKTSISGTTTPPQAPAAGAAVPTAASVNPLLLPIGAVAAAFPAIAQTMNYSGDPKALPSIKLATASVSSVDTAASVQSNLAAATPGAPSGQITGINIITANGVNLATGTAGQSTLGGLPAFRFMSTMAGPVGSSWAGYVVPYSPTPNQAGYVYQTFGGWTSIPSANNFWDGWFSTGIPTPPATLPVAGTASYTGQTVGTYVDANTGDAADVNAVLNATANFATQSLTFATSGSTMLSWNAPAGTPGTANSGLDMNGLLSYATGSNTFTGSVTAANGMSGNATGRFYGPGIGAATAGAPAEIGGTFAVAGTGIGAMQGAFAGKTRTAPTSITGTVQAPAAPAADITHPGTLTMLTEPNSTTQGSSIVQSADYAFDPAAAAAFMPTLKISTLTVQPVNTQNGNTITITTGTASPTIPATGQTTEITLSAGATTAVFSTATGSTATLTTNIAELQTVSMHDPATAASFDYALPFSPRSNPTGYVYQTFGMWNSINAATGVASENYFSAGVPALPASLPVTGTATYTGKAAGSFVDAATRDPSDTSATMNATANFAALSLSFSTTGTTSLSANAFPGTLPTANPGLDMTGILNYAAGTNTFTGTVTTANGMSGNATGRFYGPSRTTAGSPPEIGGTFALMGAGIGAMQGAFGGTAIPWASTITITGVTTPAVAPVSPAPGWGHLNMLARPNSGGGGGAIAQEMNYIFDYTAVNPTLATYLPATVDIKPVETNTAALGIVTGAAYPADATLGQTIAVNNVTSAGWSFPLSNANGSVTSQTTDIAGLPTVTLTGGSTGLAPLSEYVMPYSASLNPAGYTYQTFGVWRYGSAATPIVTEDYFSAGAPTAVAAMPVTGTATYTGKAGGTFIEATTRNASYTTAAMLATANFGTLSVAFSTTGTTSRAANATPGTPPTANPDLDLNGILNFAAGSNTFTGNVTSAGGMTGNTTGRFYGPGINTSGAPPEIGGTFALSGMGLGTMQGAFGGSINTAAGPLTTTAPAPVPMVISGVATPPAAPADGMATASKDMQTGWMWPAMGQATDYAYDFAAAAIPSPTSPTLKVSSLTVKPVDTTTGNMLSITPIGGVGAGLDASIGGVTSWFDSSRGAIGSQTADVAGLPTGTFAYSDGISKAGYVLPYSATSNPAGYSYQTFGSWASVNSGTGVNSETYFSAGVVTVSTALPIFGTATYTGQAAGSFVDAASGDPASVTATMNATANFGLRSITFATTGTTTLSRNAPAGTLPAANAGLNMNGTLSYAAGSSTFTGTVTTGNGMAGNATGRFYGPGITVLSPTKVFGAPPEIGGTFAVMGAAGAMQGAFGGK